MSGPTRANVSSVDALREFRAMLLLYQEALRDACEDLQLQMRRGVQWIEEDRATYWPNEVRRLYDALNQAKDALSACRMRNLGDHQPMCYDEKKKVVEVKDHLETAQMKVKLVQSWRGVVDREAGDFETRIVQVGEFADIELPKAIAALERMIGSLDQYAAAALPEKMITPTSEEKEQP